LTLALFISGADVFLITGCWIRIPPIVVPILIRLVTLAARSSHGTVVLVTHVFTIFTVFFRMNMVTRTPTSIGPVAEQNASFWLRADALLTVGGFSRRQMRGLGRLVELDWFQGR